MRLTDRDLDPRGLITQLGMRPHPEGGYFAEIFRHSPADGSRGHSTAIYYLLTPGDRSHWHRVDADEGWHWYGGGALELRLSDGKGVKTILLGPDLAAGQRPFAMVPRGMWQAAAPRDGWVLCGCTVAPAFTFDGFELAPPDWEPPADDRSAEEREGLNRKGGEA
jgi:predicted cupin superfamily sugar epimerase